MCTMQTRHALPTLQEASHTCTESAGSQCTRKQAKEPANFLNEGQKTQCPSTLILTLQVPWKKQQRASQCHPYLLSHKAVLRIDFTHNHPLTAAHSPSFRPVREDSSVRATLPHLPDTHMSKCFCSM